MPDITRHTWRFSIGAELTHPEVVCSLAGRLLTHMPSQCAEIFPEPRVIIEADLLAKKEPYSR